MGKEIFRELTETENVFRVTVDYKQTKAEMVAAGHYEDVDPRIISEHFPSTKREGQVEIYLEHLDHPNSMWGVFPRFGGMELRPAELPELLALGAQYPDIQRRFPIIGSVVSIYTSAEEAGDIDHWGTDPYAPCLSVKYKTNKRTLYLAYGGAGWSPDCHLAVVYRPQSQSRSLWQRLFRL